MDVIWQILVQFVFRLTFGVALSMAITPARWVTSGFFRVHLWVLLGVNTFGALVLFSDRESLNHGTWLFALAVALAAASYIGAVCWLYERPRAGKTVLWLIAGVSALAAVGAMPIAGELVSAAAILSVFDMITGGLLLGATITAMFLGHWYLNTPTMQLSPLRRLVMLLAVAAILRVAVCGVGLALEVSTASTIATQFWIFTAFRWLSGLLGVLIIAKLTWETLKIPNTQSATGILYAGVILSFLGELTSQLMSVETTYPV